MWGYTFIPEFYVGDEEESIFEAEFLTYCDTLWNCFISTLHMGVRFGGGIGEALGNAPKSYEKYETRIVFDLLFFIIVAIILLNIVFGIIIDTFAELRDERREKSRLLHNLCFICGIDRS